MSAPKSAAPVSSGTTPVSVSTATEPSGVSRRTAVLWELSWLVGWRVSVTPPPKSQGFPRAKGRSKGSTLSSR